MPIDRLVLIVGGGASRKLGSEDRQLPLMGDWNNILRKALDARSSGLADLVGIHADQSGPDFERAVGEFLAWQRSLDLAARFLPLGLRDRTDDDVRQWKDEADSRAKAVVKTLHGSLYEQFGSHRIEPAASKAAYRALFERFDLSSGATVTIATTNYDPAVELALAELDMRPDVGEVAGPSKETLLRPEHLIAKCEDGRGVAVLHLHGKVGWYTQSDGRVRIEPEHLYNESSGTPTVVMPAPDKDPFEEPAIQALWNEFGIALRQATHVLVVGHSLHDRLLVERICTQAGATHKAVSVLPDADGPELIDRLKDLLPGARHIPIDFGPEPNIGSLEEWGGDLRRA